MDEKRSIYDIIQKAYIGGRLEEGFSLPAAEDGTEISFADGALDGITYYHTARRKLDEAGTELMARALRYAGDGYVKDADTAFAELGKDYRAISIIDDLQNYIRGHGGDFPPKTLYQSALALMMQSADRESVKFGLSIMELFRFRDPGTKEVVRRLGMCDEFTIFSVWNMLKWNGGNRDIFSLIRTVRGWGRIHALEKLVPETSGIREWILYNGVDNDVSPSYSALTTWEKADVQTRLKGQLTQEEFAAIGRIFRALLDEGPVPGISGVDDAEEYALKYLSQSDAFEMTIDDYEAVLDIYNWAVREEVRNPEITAKCAAIMAFDRCAKTVEEAVKTGRGVSLARMLGIACPDEHQNR